LSKKIQKVQENLLNQYGGLGERFCEKSEFCATRGRVKRHKKEKGDEHDLSH